MGDWTQERFNDYKAEVNKIYNSVPFEYYPGYNGCNVPTVLKSTDILVGVEQELNDTEIDIHISAKILEKKENKELSFHHLFGIYSYNLKINSDDDEESAAKDLIDLYNLHPTSFVNDDGFLDETTTGEFSWRLSELRVDTGSTRISEEDLEKITIHDFLTNK